MARDLPRSGRVFRLAKRAPCDQDFHVTEIESVFRPTQTPASGGRGGRWFFAGMGIFLALLGSLFVWLLGRSFLRAWNMRSWPEVRCVVLASDVEERRHDEFSPMEFRQNLTYGYEYRGEARTGSHLTLRNNPWSSNRGLVEARAAEMPIGQETTCRVDPASPDFSVLTPDSLAPGYTIWFPGLFVVGGIGICVRALRRG